MENETAWRDPILEEIYQHWDEYAKQFDYDLEKICLDLIRRQEERKKQDVSSTAKPLP